MFATLDYKWKEMGHKGVNSGAPIPTACDCRMSLTR